MRREKKLNCLLHVFTIKKFSFLVYVGAGTVAASVWWYMTASSGPHLNYWHLVRLFLMKKFLKNNLFL